MPTRATRWATEASGVGFGFTSVGHTQATDDEGDAMKAVIVQRQPDLCAPLIHP
jgi:hypothetical protein